MLPSQFSDWSVSHSGESSHHSHSVIHSSLQRYSAGPLVERSDNLYPQSKVSLSTTPQIPHRSHFQIVFRIGSFFERIWELPFFADGLLLAASHFFFFDFPFYL